MLPSITLDALIFPNIIATKSAVQNDRWIIDPLFENCASYELVILNRWGQEVFKSNQSSNPFEGRDYNGEYLAEGIYFYLFTAGQEKRQGFIHLKH
jgi:gliding motility-associated-like protein